ncbi:hypothetical protein [Methylocapsa palsarum]|uniref:Uncharacterized protein n=1 Tax=Methylocapsa palsarum TaxID=1612308 RepID=A0A1I4AQL1_9HYPH|nr:hypothetical protein [Methylocapsa palsarum]SFK58227.1 hypothetical protein SAMN05444581_11129 [Methylocapsa palsarum]
MLRLLSKIIVVSGMLVASALLSGGANAHECRNLWQPTVTTPPAPGAYFICVGFSHEDPSQGYPGEGKKNNIDFFPLWVFGPGDNDFNSLDVSVGDVVEVKATIYYLNSNYNGVTEDSDPPPGYFFTTPGGFEAPIPICDDDKYDNRNKNRCRSFKKELQLTNKVFSEDWWSYRDRVDFVTPFPGTYAFVLSGKLKRKGQQAIEFHSKWVSESPRIPYGPFWNPTGAHHGDPSFYVKAPEFWFSGVAPAGTRAADMHSPSPRPQSALKALLNGN